MTAPKDPAKILKETVEKTIEVVAEHVEPGPRDAEETVEKVIETVDNDKVKAALEGFDRKHDDAMQATQQPDFKQHENKIADKKDAG